MDAMGRSIKRVRVVGGGEGPVCVSIGGVTLRLQPDDLVAVSRAMNAWVLRHPRYLATSAELQDERIDHGLAC